jgi:hypothetical protein
LKESPGLTRLITDLTDNNPDNAFNITTPFFKGSLFLRYIEDKLGGEGNPQYRFFFGRVSF